jgi:hypothetical protein
MRQLFLLPVLVVAACSFPQAPRPAEVSLTQNSLSVRMWNGETCQGPRPTGTSGGWSGRLQDCSAAYDYHIAMASGTNPLRMVFDEIRGAVGLQGTAVPIATITISDGGGRDYIFATPERRVR